MDSLRLFLPAGVFTILRHQKRIKNIFKNIERFPNEIVLLYESDFSSRFSRQKIGIG